MHCAGDWLAAGPPPWSHPLLLFCQKPWSSVWVIRDLSQIFYYFFLDYVEGIAGLLRGCGLWFVKCGRWEGEGSELCRVRFQTRLVALFQNNKHYHPNNAWKKWEKMLFKGVQRFSFICLAGRRKRDNAAS